MGMNAPPPGPNPNPPGNTIKAQRRDARLKAALKANIARRKAQAQSRATPTQEAENAPPATEE
jgi:hypothetical protein